MSSHSDEPAQVHRGLKGVYFERSGVSSIDGRAGELRYRGYSIHDLAEQSSFEEICFLLLHGELPTESELDEFDCALKALRNIPDTVHDIIRKTRHAHPMDVLRTAVSALGALDEDASNISRDVVLKKGLSLTSQVPVIVAAHHRLRNGVEPVSPSRDLGHAANFLYMLKGEAPSENAAALMDTDMILHAEHGSNASSFTARVVTGTGANVYAAVTAAIGALSGPAHGGAAENVMKMAQEIGDPANAADYVRARRKMREPIMGFGHRVYRAEDPRAKHLRAGVERLSKEMGEPRWYEILRAVEKAMARYSRHGVNVNVDFYAGVVYHLHEIPNDLFVPIFAIGRVPGWTAQILEQLRQNILIRPLTLYNGPVARPYVPLAER
ncbi:MAG: citrate/2-methylcitrate synthase [Woeseia sp.]